MFLPDAFLTGAEKAFIEPTHLNQLWMWANGYQSPEGLRALTALMIILEDPKGQILELEPRVSSFHRRGI